MLPMLPMLGEIKVLNKRLITLEKQSLIRIFKVKAPGEYHERAMRTLYEALEIMERAKNEET